MIPAPRRHVPPFGYSLDQPFPLMGAIPPFLPASSSTDAIVMVETFPLHRKKVKGRPSEGGIIKAPKKDRF